MGKVAMIVGGVLIVVGGVITLASSSNSVTSLIPSFIGVVYVLLGAIAAAKPGLNHHMMHGAAGLSLLAIVASLGSAIGRGSTGWALTSQLLTVAIATVFLVLAIRSFRAARIARQAAESSSTS